MNRYNLSSALLSLILLDACGGEGVIPDAPDAADAPFICECPPAEVLTAQRIWRDRGSISAIAGTSYSCPATDKLLAGSCIRDTIEPDMEMCMTGFRDFLGMDSWGCGWWNPSFQPTPISATVICLRQATEPADTPAGCDCPPPQPMAERIVRVEQAGNLPPSTHATVKSQCEEGQLIGGSCVVQYAQWSDKTSLFSAGFASDDSWQCSWNNLHTTNFTGTATAICLLPSGPGTAPEIEPLTDRIIRKDDIATLPAGDLYLHDVTCDPGDYLLWGSCALQEINPLFTDIHLFRSGFPGSAQERPNTWQCAWNNPTAVAPRVTATAVCLKPPTNP